MTTKKPLSIILFLTVFMFGILNLQSQSCPESLELSNVNEVINFLDTHREGLKTARAWARKNNRPKIELVTNKLEYWSKDIKRYILKYKDSHPTKVCERLYKKEAHYFVDFFNLAVLYKNFPNGVSIDYSKYK